ncbi:hypothetical protein HY933_03895 [Candidatus Falkowbacteria bacterium]|nr:hypothetical protein [Candidatus Falkowbacteria bacterium]
MGHVLYPPNIVEIPGGTIFLAGPIQGAARWQTEAITIIHELDDTPNIACPRRPAPIRKEFGQVEYNAQVDWETHCLRQAGRSGVIMFWLAREFEHICARAYAQTSRFELGEWKIRHERDGVKLAVGIESGFTNERYIRRRIGQDCLDIVVCASLRATCEQAVKLFHV